MAKKHAHLAQQLRLACKSSGARWAAWIYITAGTNHTPGPWQIALQEGLTKPWQKALTEFLNQPARHRWISGALSSGRPRWQEINQNEIPLGCGRIYLYPCSGSCQESDQIIVLVAGADGLSTQSEATLRMIGLNPPGCLSFEADQDTDADAGLKTRPAQRAEDTHPQKPQAPALEQLEALHKTSLEISARLELNILLQHIALRARELVAAVGAEVGLIEEARSGDDGDHAVMGVRLTICETPWPAMQGTFIPFMTGLAGKIAALSTTLNIPDYNTWDGRLLPEKLAPFKAVAGVPLLLDGKVIGTLTVLDDRPDKQFNEDDVAILKRFGAQAAIAIQNARLYEELNNRIEAQFRAEKRLIRSAQLAAIGDISTQIANEINAPIRRTAMLLEMALKQLPDDNSLAPAAMRDLRLAYQQAQRAREMTHRLLLAVRETHLIENEDEPA